MSSYYPAPLPVPHGLSCALFEVRMLSAADVDLDLEAVEASRAALLRRSNGRWPRLGFDWRDNLADLVGHQIEHLQREAFTYTLMRRSGDRCLGCLYLRPLGQHLARLGAPQETLAAVPARASGATFWLRPDAVALGLDRALLARLLPWFSQAWEFSEVQLIGNSAEVRNRRLFEAAGLPLGHTLRGPDGRSWHFYRATPLPGETRRSRSGGDRE